jgi:hypothetical protein
MWLELLLQRFSRAKLVVHRRIGTRGIEIDPQLILVDEVHDEAALSLVMRAYEMDERQWMGDEAHSW